ncbi:MAG: hypothetical protein AAF206_24575 [Bacteroidota bacterium]
MPAQLRAYLPYVMLVFALMSQGLRNSSFFTYTGHDRNQQIGAAYSFLSGEGLTQAVYAQGQVTKHEVKGWPPAYAYLFAGLLAVSDLSPFLLAELLSICGLTACMLAAWCLLSVLDASRKLHMIWFGFQIVAFSPFHYTTASGEFALAFFLLGLAALLASKPKGKLALGCFLLAALFRYAYWPLLLLPVLLSWRTPKRAVAYLTGAGTLLIVLSVLLWPEHSDGSDLSSLFSGELYWDQLLQIDAFPVKAFFYLSLLGLSNKIAISAVVLWTIKILFLGFSLLIGYLLLRSWKAGDKAFPEGIAATVLLLPGLLCSLSVLRPAEVHDGSFAWTFVMETRYYAPLLVLIQMFVMRYWLGVRKRLMALLLGAALLYGGLHTSHRLYQLWGKNNPRESRFEPLEQHLLYVYQAISETTHKRVFAHGDLIWEDDESRIAGWAGAAVSTFESVLNHPPSEDFVLFWSDTKAPPALLNRDWQMIRQTKERQLWKGEWKAKK